MHYLDIVLLLIIFLFFYLGVRRGFLLTFTQLLGIVLIIVLVRQFGVILQHGIHTKIGISENWALILGYIVIFLIIMYLAKVISNFLQNILAFISLGWIDRLMGGIFNIVFGSAIIVILVMILEVSTIATVLGESRDRSVFYSSAKVIAEDIITKYSEVFSDNNPAKERFYRHYRSRGV